MANQTIFEQITFPTVVGADWIPVWKDAAGMPGKVSVTNLLDGIAGVVATLATNQTITGIKTFSGNNIYSGTSTYTGEITANAKTYFNREVVIAPTNTGDIGLFINMPSGAIERPLRVRLNNVERFNLNITSSLSVFNMSGFDNGTGSGPGISVAGNTNGSTPAPGYIRIDASDTAQNFIYPDSSDVLRLLVGAAPTNANQGTGTVIGSQTSMVAAKHIFDELSTIDEVLERIAVGAQSIRRFVYKNGAFNGEQFEGIITDLAPAYGYDRDKAHPQGRALNEIQAIGDLIRAVAWLAERVRV